MKKDPEDLELIAKINKLLKEKGILTHLDAAGEGLSPEDIQELRETFEDIDSVLSSDEGSRAQD